MDFQKFLDLYAPIHLIGAAIYCFLRFMPAMKRNGWIILPVWLWAVFFFWEALALILLAKKGLGIKD